MTFVPRVAGAALVLLTLLCARAAFAAPCTAPPYHEFDFWLGDWDVFETSGGPKEARLHVSRTLDGCVVHEIYEQGEERGESFTIYDAVRRVWHQTWVTNGGVLLTIEGARRANGAITMRGVESIPGHGRRRVTGTWEPVGANVREFAETSSDGKAWRPWFDITFRRHSAQ